jgi:hypothetical protein
MHVHMYARIYLTSYARALGHSKHHLRNPILLSVRARNCQYIETSKARSELLGVADAPKRAVNKDAQAVA